MKRWLASLLVSALLPLQALAAFPQVVTESSSSHNNVTNHTVTLPGSLVSGNLLVCTFAVDWGAATTTSVPTNWTRLGSLTASGTNVALTAYYKVSNGSEGASITVTTDAAEHSTHKCWQISGHDSGTAPQIAFSSNTSAGNPDPPSLTPTGGAKDYLWLAVAGFDLSVDSTITCSAYPTNYTNTGYQQNSPLATGGTTTCWGRRELNAASEDPGTFTGTPSNEQYVAATIAVHPTSCTPSPAITDVDTDETVTATQTNVIITGTGFCTQGTGTVTLRQSGNSKTLTVDSWADTSIQVDMSGVGMGVANGLLYGSMDVRVTGDGGSALDDQAITVTAPSGTAYATLSGGLVTLAFDEYGNPSRLFGDPTDLSSTSQVAWRAVTGTAMDETDVTINADGSVQTSEDVTGFNWDFSSGGLYVGTVATWAVNGIPPTFGGVDIPDMVFARNLAITPIDLADYFFAGDAALSSYSLKQLGASTAVTAINGAVTLGTTWTVDDASGLLDDVGGYVKCGSGEAVRLKWANPVDNTLGLWDARTCADNDTVSTVAVGAGAVSGLSITGSELSGTPDTVQSVSGLVFRVTDSAGLTADSR